MYNLTRPEIPEGGKKRRKRKVRTTLSNQSLLVLFDSSREKQLTLGENEDLVLSSLGDSSSEVSNVGLGGHVELVVGSEVPRRREREANAIERTEHVRQFGSLLNKERVEIIKKLNLLLDLRSRDSDSRVLLGVDDALLRREERKMERGRGWGRWKGMEEGRVSSLLLLTLARERNIRLTRLKVVGVDGRDLLPHVSVRLERDEGERGRDEERRGGGSWDGGDLRATFLLPSSPSPLLPLDPMQISSRNNLEVVDKSPSSSPRVKNHAIRSEEGEKRARRLRTRFFHRHLVLLFNSLSFLHRLAWDSSQT